MHISLDSALGRQRRLNQVGESITQIAPDPVAAYSLRSLTGGDPRAVRVRRVRNDEQDFTVSEVSSGALVDFALNNTKSLLNSRAYFDGSNDNVGLTNEIDLTGDFSVEYSFVVTETEQQIIGKNAGGSYLRAQGTGEITAFRIQTNSGAESVNLTSNLKYGEANTIKLKRVSGKFGIYNESDVLISAEFTNSDTFTISSFGKARGSFAKGVIYNIRIDTNNDGTIDHSYNGYGNSVSDWTDLVGSNNAAAVNGSPALFTGQDQDGFVDTWYDQSGNNHAINDTNVEQPKIVSSGTLLNELDFDGSDDTLDFTELNESDISIFSVAHFDDAAGQDRIISGQGNDSGEGFGKASSDRGFFRANGQSARSPILNVTISADQDILLSFIRASNTCTFFTNGTASDTFTDSGAFGAGSIGGAGSKIDGSIKELIIYSSDQTSSRTAIETNINGHYSIF